MCENSQCLERLRKRSLFYCLKEKIKETYHVGTDFWLQLILVLACLFYGARKGGMALGLLGGVGLIVLVFGFGLNRVNRRST